jgi:hypothetical protein
VDGKTNVVSPSEAKSGNWGGLDTRHGLCDCPCKQQTSFYVESGEICWPQTEALRTRARDPQALERWTALMPGIDDKLEALGWNAEDIKWQMLGFELSVGYTPIDMEVAKYLATTLDLGIVDLDTFSPLR